MIISLLGILKPKIVFGNIISCLGGFLLASKGNVNYNLLFWSLISVSLVVGSSCILNNVIDRNIDKNMNRTKKRILVINPCFYRFSIFSSIFLAMLGLFLFGWFINILCVFLSCLGVIVYSFFYSFLLKTKSIYSTIIGSISGAIPSLLGYCSVTNYIDLCTVNLFIIMFFWQIPHSYAIFVMNLDDYKKAKIPVYPVIKPIWVTKRCVSIFIFLFLISIFCLTAIGYAGYKFFLILSLLSIIWFFLSIKEYHNDKKNIFWSKNIFYLSIVIMIVLNIMISIDFVN
ncbi:MAG: heme o synthase [Buchnera aphidicola (Nurudea shiraii)]